MKNICLFLCAGWLLAGCQKMETGAVFTVNCQFSSFIVAPRGLVLTNAKGEVVHSFSIPAGATEFKSFFTLPGNDPTEKLDYHLISNFANNFGFPNAIASHLGVSSGELVFLDPLDRSLPGGNQFNSQGFINVILTDTHTIDTFSVSNYFTTAEQLYIYPDDETATFALPLQDTQNIVFRMRANLVSDVRYKILFRQPLKSQDTAFVSWNDFKPIGNATTIELPDGLKATHSEVAALSPTRRTYTVLAYDDALSGILFTPKFWWPDEVKTNEQLRVFVTTGSADFEQIFQPGQPIRFESSGMHIGGVSSIPGRQISVSTSGDVDLIRVRATTFSGSFNQSTVWQIDGPPDAFANYSLPDLSPFLPKEVNLDVFFGNFVAEAHQFAQYNYPDIRAGFPWKSPAKDGYYAVANSGHKVVYQWR